MQLHLKHRIAGKIAVLVGLGILLATPSLAFADHGKGGLLFGTVTAGSCAGKGSFEVSTPSGTTVTLKTNKQTVCVPKSSMAVVAGFQKGDAVLVASRTNKGKVAKKVIYDTAPFALPGNNRTYNGNYADSSGNTITINLHNGSQETFVVDSNTTYTENGKQVTSPSFSPDEHIVAHCHRYTDGRDWASAVMIHGPHGKHQD